MMSEQEDIREMQLRELFNFVNELTRKSDPASLLSEYMIENMIHRVTEVSEYYAYVIGLIVRSRCVE
jgi:hypothetical protein